jgi:uncharacterized protein (TIGR03437 family)
MGYTPTYTSTVATPTIVSMSGNNSYTGVASGSPKDLIGGLTATPIQPGETLVIYGTGFAPTNPETPADKTVVAPLPLANPSRLWIDTSEVSLQFAGLVSAGLYQFNFPMPDLPNGDCVVSASVGGVRTGKIARMKIQK